MKIGFYSSRIPFEADLSINGKAGGSENALVNISRNWKKNYPDDEIIIYNNNSGKFKEYDGIKWRTLLDFDLEIRSAKLDVLISLREPKIFKLPYIDAKLKCLWSQDDMNESDLIWLKNEEYCKMNIDLIFVISEYAYNSIKESFPSSRIHIIRNGYNNDWLENSEKKPVAVYTSTPFRGLNLLCDFWPTIYKSCIRNSIEPQLKIFSSMSLYNSTDSNFQELYDKLKKQKGIKVYGAIPQKKLYEELKEASVILYPNTYIETGCMAITEALANNLWVVTTNLGALGEQVINNKNGYLINKDPHSKEYEESFIYYAVKTLMNPKGHIPNNDGLIFTWSEQAKKMRNIILEKF